MPFDKLSSDLQRFIFEYIDSISLLEALLVVRSHPGKYWTSITLSQELRSNPQLATQYLNKMEAMKLVHTNPSSIEEYIYDDSQSGFTQIINELAEEHRKQRHKIYELVYSPLKKARDFSEAFRFRASEKKEDENG